MEDRVAHGLGRIEELQAAFEQSEAFRLEQLTEDELRALGTIITLEGDDPAFPLKLDSLQRLARASARDQAPSWVLLSVLPADAHGGGLGERATVWVSDKHRVAFLQLFEDYLNPDKDSPTGKPANSGLVANIALIRSTILRDLWQSDGAPPVDSLVWWEIWLRPSDDGMGILTRFAEELGLRFSPRRLRLIDRDVVWVEATWEQLQGLPFTAVPVAEIRRPEFVESISQLTRDEQAEYVDDLASRLEPAHDAQPAVCHLDSGVRRTHVLLDGSLAASDMHSVLGGNGFDHSGHGTWMAGLALFGNLEGSLLARHDVHLRHRLESVRILLNGSDSVGVPRVYGDVTAQAVSLPEATAVRRRVFCMPVSAKSDTASVPGQPTLWSATLDALAVGTGVVSSNDELQLLSSPDSRAARLFVVSAGNVDSANFTKDHLDESDTAAITDPGQAWNALTVGAFTELAAVPTGPDYAGWSPVAPAGELSPFSRTSLPFGFKPWPIKPDIVLEGGNLLHDGGSDFEEGAPPVSLLTTGVSNDRSLAAANATSAATAQASRLAALVMASYPDYWPETVRGLLVHAAEWTPAMRVALDAARGGGRRAQQALLRRYGWGVPTEDRVLYSSDQAVTLVVQDEFVPFEGADFKVPLFRLHDLPWPAEVLQEIGAGSVSLKVTLSYFIEPNASRRGWRQRYVYPSHGLRFELQDALESEAQFIQRVGRASQTEEDGGGASGGNVDWLVGPGQRNYGSLHQDILETSGAELARSSRLAVYPVGGWWKNNRKRGRIDHPVRYSLVVSLKTETNDVDLYTPVASLLRITTPIPAE